MNLHVHADYAPPRSWEQFEELCADIFQSAWRDPALVRHGRAGQRQNGVDIVGRNGALYPIGLQCKKRSRWPVSRITTKQIDAEIKEALNFEPALKAFYILTSAPDDAVLLDHVRTVNEQHEKEDLFEVVLLGWGEIVRRATLDPHVAEKHFGPSGGGAPRSPLLATWMMSKHKLEKTGDELELSTKELIQDLHDWPSGHIVIRQRESDALLEQLRSYEGRKLTTNDRKKRIKLRNDLHILTDAETKAAQTIKFMLTDPDVSVWLLKVWEEDAPLAIEAFINNHLPPRVYSSVTSDHVLRMSPPGDPERRCSAYISQKDVSAIRNIMEWRREKYGKPLTDTVDELPPDVRARVAIPRIVRGIFEFISEDRLTWDQIRQINGLQIGQWSVSIA
ncbi:MAG: hypothetical protein HQL85_13265 [Magnetococcales bacterium]|nr:hypothetical protein [Magnetococcales bacterium]MBF0155507.1 hypothetical protein [Magnetococcales bacterium]